MPIRRNAIAMKGIVIAIQTILACGLPSHLAAQTACGVGTTDTSQDGDEGGAPDDGDDSDDGGDGGGGSGTADARDDLPDDVRDRMSDGEDGSEFGGGPSGFDRQIADGLQAQREAILQAGIPFGTPDLDRDSIAALTAKPKKFIDPIDIAVADKLHAQVDYASLGAGQLRLSRV